jgi:signal peptidase II
VQERGTRPALTALRRLGLLGAVAAAVVLVDQATKSWAVSNLVDHNVHVIWTLQLALTFNSGAAFSRATGSGTIIALVAIGVVCILVWLGRGITSVAGSIALGLVLGGALGNLADRTFRDGSGFLGGRVVDFIDVRWWPVFNVADAAVSIGAIGLVIVLGVRSDP